jgi:hypothetical protein
MRGDVLGRPGEHLKRARHIQALYAVEHRDYDEPGLHASILPASIGDSNVHYPAFPAIGAGRARPGGELLGLRWTSLARLASLTTRVQNVLCDRNDQCQCPADQACGCPAAACGS